MLYCFHFKIAYYTEKAFFLTLTGTSKHKSIIHKQNISKELKHTIKVLKRKMVREDKEIKEL